jgi:endo-1,4-beta-xylanase
MRTTKTFVLGGSASLIALALAGHLPLAGCVTTRANGPAAPASVTEREAGAPVDAGGDNRNASDGGIAFLDGGGPPADAATASGDCGVPETFRWSSTGPILAPVSDPTHNLVSIKDPSVVYYNGKWHVFVSTVDVNGVYSMAYMSFADWSSTASASIYYLSDDPGLGGYTAAPQVFYFAPQNKWYLVFQSGPPMYSTNEDVGNPSGWTQATPFFSQTPAIVKNDAGNGVWLDFWVICDSANCYLFFSGDNGGYYRSQTSIGNFPNGFGDPVIVMSSPNAGDLFEASNVYSMPGTGKYLALVEAFDAQSNYHRFFRSWTADALDGTWTPLQDTFQAPFASTANVTFDGGAWSDDISHGEMIRGGYDQTLAIDTCNLRYLYQGFDPSEAGAPYNSIPWRLGLLTKTN